MPSCQESIDIIVSSMQKLCLFCDNITNKISNADSLVYNCGIIIDLKFYRKIYPDLSIIKTDEDLLEHYIHFGKNERRLSCENLFDFIYPCFDVNEYRKKYQDLNQFNDMQLKAHYFQHGRFEGRTYLSPIL